MEGLTALANTCLANPVASPMEKSTILNNALTTLYAAINVPFWGVDRGDSRDWRNPNDANDYIMLGSGAQAPGPRNLAAPSHNTCGRARPRRRNSNATMLMRVPSIPSPKAAEKGP